MIQIKNYNPEDIEISNVSHSGNYSLHFKSAPDRFISVAQIVNFEKGFQYEVCAYVKFLNNVTIRISGFIIQSYNKTSGFYEKYNSRSYSRLIDWQKICFKTGVIKKYTANSEPYWFGIYIYRSTENTEGFIDDVPIERSNFIIRINNDRDEVYDNVNVVYRIYANKETYNLSDFELITRIRDENNITFTEKKIKIPSFSFTDSINIQKIKLKENNFYQVESMLNNKKDNIIDISSYPFKKNKK